MYSKKDEEKVLFSGARYREIASKGIFSVTNNG
jgi:hypothetical protein